MKLGSLGLEFECSLARRNRFIGSPASRQYGGEIAMALRISWRHFESLPVRRLCFFELSQVTQDVAEVRERLRVIRIELDGCTKGGGRRLEVRARLEYHAETIVKLWRLRPSSDSLSDRIDGAPVVAGAPCNEPENVQCIGVVRL